MVNVQNNALADQIQQSTELPQIRSERIGKAEKDFELDACSGHSQTFGGTHVVPGDFASIKMKQTWQSPSRVALRRGRRFQANESEDTGGESITARV